MRSLLALAVAACHASPAAPALGRFESVSVPLTFPARDPGDTSCDRLVNVASLPAGHVGVWSGAFPIPPADCAWDGAKVACISTAKVTIAAPDLDGDGAADRIFADGTVTFATGSTQTIASEGIGWAASDQPWLAVSSPDGPCIGSRTVHFLRWEAGALVEKALVDLPQFQMRDLAAGTLLGRETVVVVGLGCNGDHTVDTVQAFAWDGSALARADILDDDQLRAGQSGTQAPMGVAIADLTGDGRNDLVIPLDPLVDYLVDDGSGKLRPSAWDPGFDEPNLIGWGTVTLDLDGDGRLDVCVANGNDADRWAQHHAPMWPACFWNAGNVDGQFVNVSSSMGLDQFAGQWRGLASGDLNADGNRDLYIGSQGGPPLVLLRQKP